MLVRAEESTKDLHDGNPGSFRTFCNIHHPLPSLSDCVKVTHKSKLRHLSPERSTFGASGGRGFRGLGSSWKGEKGGWGSGREKPCFCYCADFSPSILYPAATGTMYLVTVLRKTARL